MRRGSDAQRTAGFQDEKRGETREREIISRLIPHSGSDERNGAAATAEEVHTAAAPSMRVRERERYLFMPRPTTTTEAASAPQHTAAVPQVGRIRPKMFRG